MNSRNTCLNVCIWKYIYIYIYIYINMCIWKIMLEILSALMWGHTSFRLGCARYCNPHRICYKGIKTIHNSPFWVQWGGAALKLSKKLATVVEGDQKAPFSIATTPRCRGGRYSFLWIAPFYPWSSPYIAEC